MKTPQDSLRSISLLRAVCIFALAVSFAYMAIRSLHWPMLVDSPIMHYVNFLMDHGMRPYTDITDNNMPGAYLTERWATALFGGGDLGWRIYDLFLLMVMTAAMTAIAWPYDRLAGLYAGGLFSLMHISEGAWFVGEREEVMAALLLTSCACLFWSARRSMPWLAGVFGFLAAMAASIKPTLSPFALCALLLLFVHLRGRGTKSAGYVLWALGGMSIAVALNLAFVVRYHALEPLLFIFRKVLPAYIGLNQPGWRFMVRHALPGGFLALLALALLAFALRRRRLNWEQGVLLLGAGVGYASYFLQQKGFFHHRYLGVAFLLLLVGTELLAATRKAGWVRLVGCAGLVLPLVTAVPGFVSRFRFLPPTGGLVRSMEADLRGMGGERLQGDVQCFDLVFGCLNSLYHVGLVENTGFTGDLLLFTRETSPATEYYRQKFWQTQAVHPAAVLVITNEVFGEANSFAKIERWPEFAKYVRQNYSLAVTRTFPREDVWGEPLPADKARAYRIYVRNGSDLLRAAPEAAEVGEPRS